MYGLRGALIACCIYGITTCPAGAEDLTVVSKITSPVSGTFTFYISSDEVRLTSGSRDFIYSLANGKFLAADHAAKIYYEWTSQERAVSHRLTQELEQEQEEAGRRAEEQLRTLPPDTVGKDLRKLADEARALKERYETSTAVQKLDGKRTIAGYTCDPYAIVTDFRAADLRQQGNAGKIERCLTTELQAPAFFEFLEAVSDDFTDAQVRFQLPGMAQALDEIKRKGFPLSGKNLPDGKNVPDLAAFPDLAAIDAALKSKGIFPRGVPLEALSWEATQVMKGPIDRSIFAIALPAAYKKVVSPMAARTKFAEYHKELNRMSAISLSGISPSGPPPNFEQISKQAEKILELTSRSNEIMEEYMQNSLGLGVVAYDSR